MPSSIKKLQNNMNQMWVTKPLGTQKKSRHLTKNAKSRILLRKLLSANGQPTLDTVPQSALNLLAQGMTSIAFKLSFDSGSIILKRSRIKYPKREIRQSDTQLKRELAFYKFIDELPNLEQQFLAKCYDWRVYDKCLYSGRGLRAANPLKPSAEPGVCLDMLLEYKGPSLADWLNARYLHTETISEKLIKTKTNNDSPAKLDVQIGKQQQAGGKRYQPKETYRLLYSIFWQLAMIFKVLDKAGWQHMDAHPHNITVVNGLTLADGRRVDYLPQKIQVPTDLLPTELLYRLEHPTAPNIIPISQQLPTQCIQIALIDYNLMRHKDFSKAEWTFAPFGTSLTGDEGQAAMNMELKRRILALVFGEHKMMAEVRRRNMPLRNFRVMVATNSTMAQRYPEEWQEWLSQLSNDPDRLLLGYVNYLTNTRDNLSDFKMLYIRIENELFWLWQINHAAEVCELYGFDTVYQPLLPKDIVMKLFFGIETRTSDDLIIWCCEKLGIRPVAPERISQAQKNETE